jgi:hypothetical protein
MRLRLSNPKEKSMKTIARTAARALWLLLFAASAASAEDARSAAVGATIKDGALNIGSRTWKLPPGDWKLAGRVLRQVRISEVRRGAEVIELYSALLQDRGLRVGLMMTGPTGPTTVPSWREDPTCRPAKALHREDSSTTTLSDCLVIRVLPSHPTKVQGADIYEAAAGWLQAEGISAPRPIINVQVVKYEGGEFFRASSWIDPAVFGLKGEEVSALTAAPEPLLQWARDYRAAAIKAMGSVSGTFSVPPLPAR